ncbi:hypothetical protein RUND412_002124 [Rhizina undulata]
MFIHRKQKEKASTATANVQVQVQVQVQEEVLAYQTPTGEILPMMRFNGDYASAAGFRTVPAVGEDAGKATVLAEKRKGGKTQKEILPPEGHVWMYVQEDGRLGFEKPGKPRKKRVVGFLRRVFGCAGGGGKR